MKKPEKLILGLFVLFIFTFITSFACADNEMLVNLDPPDRLTNKALLGEWATEGNLDGWLGNGVSGLTSTDGYITGMATTDNFNIQKTDIDGPDLDFGFFDYLQI